MDALYTRFATADPDFYDEPRLSARSDDGRYAVEADADWSGWRHSEDGHWSHWHPAEARLPDQGFKVHVGAVPEDAVETLAAVSRYCRHRGLAFKHLAHRDVLQQVDGKDGDRSASGKFITVYPADEAELHDTLVDLDGLVGGRPAPYVLSDLRWNCGPLSVRYGAFVREFTEVAGRRVPAVRAPDGQLVEDIRTTSFVVPDWVSLPPFLRAQQDALDPDPPAGLPRIVSALHHSNAGGVYAAIDGDAHVVLKEARPHAGRTPDGRDAVARLRDEARALWRIAGPSVVRIRGTLETHGHHFLVMDRVDGIPLHQAVVSRHPLVRASSTDAQRRAYREWATRIVRQIEAALDAVHAAGYSHGDLHPGNVLVTPDDRVVLLDFEMARRLEEETPATIGVPGFVPRDRRGGERLDRYALACIRVFVYAPLTTMFGLDPAAATTLTGWARERFGLDRAWAGEILDDLALPPTVITTADRVLQAWGEGAASSLDEVIDAIATKLRADATLDRIDRAWPGDPAQFAEPGFSLAHGAAGVLLSLHDAGVEAPDGAWDWFDHALAQELSSPSPRPGLGDGLAGAVRTLRRTGRHAAADRALDRLRDGDLLSRLGAELYGGLSGVGLVLLEESAADASLVPVVAQIADRVHHLYGARPQHATAPVATGAGGMLRGPSGVALFAARLYAASGDRRHLALAERAIDDDLGTCVWADDGSLHVDEGWRALPHLGSGSAGVGLALLAVAPFARDDRHAASFEGIHRAACAELVAQSGLLEGRAGLIHFLLAVRGAGLGTAETDEALTRHIRTLRLHGVRREDGIAFPGNGLLRLSCDLATGAAGVLSALIAFRDAAHRSDAAPLLDSLRRHHPSRSETTGPDPERR